METKDLLLRNWQDTDAEPLYKMCLDPALRASGIHFYDSVADSQNTIRHWKNNKGFQVIIDKRDLDFVGFINLSDMNRYDGYMELEYAIAKKYRNKGYATQALKRMVDYGFAEMNLQVIDGRGCSPNQNSARVLEKCSFSFECRLRKHARDQSDTLCYSLLKEDWENLSKDSIALP